MEIGNILGLKFCLYPYFLSLIPFKKRKSTWKNSIFRLKICICNLKIYIFNLKICIFSLKIENCSGIFKFGKGVSVFCQKERGKGGGEDGFSLISIGNNRYSIRTKSAKSFEKMI